MLRERLAKIKRTILEIRIFTSHMDIKARSHMEKGFSLKTSKDTSWVGLKH